MLDIPLRGVRAVHVDDDEEHRELFRVALERRGAEVTSFESVTAALEALENQTDVDVIVSDIAMPLRDGFALVSGVRALARHDRVPVIALSAFSAPADRARALRAGFDEHLSKSTCLNSLAATIAATIARGRGGEG